MFKSFSKINIFAIAIFLVLGILLGFMLGIEVSIKYIKISQTPPTPSIIPSPSIETRTVTGRLEFAICLVDNYEGGNEQQCLPGAPDNVLLVIVGQDGKIIKTITTSGGHAEIEITVPIDILFSLAPKLSVERGVINVVSFKEGYVETVLLNIPVFPKTRDKGILFAVPMKPLMPPGVKNNPIVGGATWQKSEIIDFIKGIANALNLKTAEY